ncbi:hypothetical protein D3C71_778280 [compost metagenome]
MTRILGSVKLITDNILCWDPIKMSSESGRTWCLWQEMVLTSICRQTIPIRIQPEREEFPDSATEETIMFQQKWNTEDISGNLSMELFFSMPIH